MRSELEKYYTEETRTEIRSQPIPANCQVAVIGGGPSGSALAAQLARNNHDVHIFDWQRFPRDKACGDGIPARAIEALYLLGMKDRILEREFYPVNQLLIGSLKGHIIRAQIPDYGDYGALSYIIPRLEFDEMIFRHAIDSGVKYHQAKATDLEFEGNQVVGVHVKDDQGKRLVQTRLVVGADGALSRVAKSLGVEIGQIHAEHRAVAGRWYVDNMEVIPQTSEFYFPEEMLPGYAWIFPNGERDGSGSANVGVGMRLDRYNLTKKNRSLDDLLDFFIGMPNVGSRFNKAEIHDESVWQLNFGSREDVKRAYNGAALIGDAAWLINPVTGGGIANALESARYLAETVNDVLLNDPDSLMPVPELELAPFERKIERNIVSGLKRAALIQRFATDHPHFSDVLIRRGGRLFAKVVMRTL